MTTFNYLVVLLHIFPVGLCLPPGLEWVTPEQMTMEKYANAIPFPVQAHDPQYNPDDWTFELVEFLLVSPVYKPIILETLGDCVEECKKYSNCAAATWSNPYKFCFFSDFEHGVRESNVGGLEYGTVIYKKVNWADSTCPRSGQSTETDPTTEELLIEEEEATSEMETTTNVAAPGTTTATTTSTTTAASTTAPTTTTTTTTPTTTTTAAHITSTTPTPATTAPITTTTTTTPTLTTADPTTTTTTTTTSTATTTPTPTTIAPTTTTTTTTTSTATTATTPGRVTTAGEDTTTEDMRPTEFTHLVMCYDDSSIVSWTIALETENECVVTSDVMSVCVAIHPANCGLTMYHPTAARTLIVPADIPGTQPFYVATSADNKCGATQQLYAASAQGRTIYKSGTIDDPDYNPMNVWVWDDSYCRQS